MLCQLGDEFDFADRSEMLWAVLAILGVTFEED